jgi:hypothetical protein
LRHIFGPRPRAAWLAGLDALGGHRHVEVAAQAHHGVDNCGGVDRVSIDCTKPCRF